MAALKKWVMPTALAVSNPVYTQHNAMHGLTGDPMTKTTFRRSVDLTGVLDSRLMEEIPGGGRVLSRTFFHQVCDLTYILTVNLNWPLFALVFVVEPVADCSSTLLTCVGRF